MSNFFVKDNKITVTSNFDGKATLFSGQVFRVKTLADNKFLVVSGDKVAIVETPETTQKRTGLEMVGAGQVTTRQASAKQVTTARTGSVQETTARASAKHVTTITCNDVEFFVDYFDLKNDYSNYLRDVKDEFALSAIGFSPALKILRQDKFETVIDFIMSANNNIKRFAVTLQLIAEKYGEKRIFEGVEYYTFPSASLLSKATESDLKALGTGYRDKYIVQTSKQIANGFDLDCVSKLDTISANKKLCELMGVGEKVADCILLFAFQKYDAFPVDTWIERLYHENYAGESVNRKEIRKFFVEKFGQYAGIIQQYLFFYKRS